MLRTNGISSLTKNIAARRGGVAITEHIQGRGNVAITSRLQWLEHAVRMMKFIFLRHPEIVKPFLEGAVAYVTEHSYDTLANRRDAARIVVNIVWKELLGQPFHPDGIRHFLVEAGVNYASSSGIPDVEEPQI